MAPFVSGSNQYTDSVSIVPRLLQMLVVHERCPRRSSSGEANRRSRCHSSRPVHPALCSSTARSRDAGELAAVICLPFADLMRTPAVRTSLRRGARNFSGSYTPNSRVSIITSTDDLKGLHFLNRIEQRSQYPFRILVVPRPNPEHWYDCAAKSRASRLSSVVFSEAAVPENCSAGLRLLIQRIPQ
jgi:hypothetical protein